MNFKHKNILVYGVSLSGEWCIKLLNKLKANTFCYDDNKDKLAETRDCFIVNELSEDLISQFDSIIVSPSVEKANKFLLIAKKLKIKIYSELEFASLFCKKYVAVTGTNGKTTTVQLITAILSKKHKAIACGNIGYPVSRAVLNNKREIKVIEVSSFMLENAETFSPHVATILNIEADHLIRHKSMSEYKALKLSILKNLKPKDFAVVNLDDKIDLNVPAKKITYSFNHLADVYQKGGYIYAKNKKFIALNEITLKGKHNVCNIMCAICYALIYKIPLNLIREAILNFTQEHFRMEKIATVNNIKFVNDSKSTNIASTLACVDSVDGAIILLLGGSNNGLKFDKFFVKLSKRVKQIVGFGEIASDLEKANKEKFNFKVCKDLKEAFDFAISVALPNDTILLSPASASYDQFKNYVERGKLFNEKVKEYADSFQKE